MDRDLLQELHQRIDRYEEEGLLSERFVVIFGSNEPAEKIMEYLEKKGIQTGGLVDNNPQKDGVKLKGVTVTLPEKLLFPKKDDIVILIASRYYPEMVVQLERMGYQEGTEILKVVEYNAYHTVSLTEEEFEKRIKIVEQGEQIYRRVCRKFPTVDKLFVCPLGKLGDVYISMSFIRQYMQFQKINSFAIAVIGKTCSKIAYLFGFENNTFVLEKQEMELLLQYAVFTEMIEGKTLIMHHRFPYICKVGEIGNYKGICFIDHYRYSVFQLEEGSLPEIPTIHRNDEQSREYVRRLFEENGLREGHTVILLPYANTASMLEEKFWELLADRLKEKGYIVCTNSGGKEEPAVAGTKELFFDLKYGLEVVEKAGIVIGLRSGLCDVISTAKAKKVILYPDRIYGPDTFMNFYSLNKNDLCSDADEILVKDDMMFSEIVERILEKI